MLISVFTPAYNRAGLLPRVYKSLLAQSFKAFEWIIVDDGSTDDTCSVVRGFLSEGILTVRYIRKQNGGKHTAINLGTNEAKGELFFILDSDDCLPEDALQTVVEEYGKVKDDGSMAGVAGLDRFEGGDLVGTGLPHGAIDCNAMDIRFCHHVKGDLKEVFRTDVLREFPFPEIEGERFCPEQLVWFRIAKKYRLHYFNKPIYIAEYQEEGITAGITKVRMNSPIASMMTYAELNSYNIPFIQKVKAAINYWRFRFCAEHKAVIPQLGKYWMWVIPIGWAMHLLDRRRVKMKNK